MPQQKLKNIDIVQKASIGVLGGGQLGMMMIEAAKEIGIAVHILDPNLAAPCAKIADTFTVGDSIIMKMSMNLEKISTF